MIRNLVRYLSLGTLIVLSIAMMASCADDDDAAGAGDEIRPITVTPTAALLRKALRISWCNR